MNKVDWPGRRMTETDLQSIAEVCCRLAAEGRIQGVVRVEEGDADQIVCVSGGRAMLGVGRQASGRYYVFDDKGSTAVQGWQLQDVIHALAA